MIAMNGDRNESDRSEFDKLLNWDRITVKVAPEKKGLILKHIEYEIRSQRYKCVVQRRFKEFVSLHDLLIIRFPFRLIPALPSKKFYGNGDIHFVEERRKALERFLNLVARHPLLSTDSLVQFFLTAKNDELELKIKDNLRNPSDELSALLENKSKEGNDLSEMDMAKYPLVKEQLRSLQHSLIKLSQIAVKTLELSRSGVIETLDFGKELKVLLTRSDDNLLFDDFGSKINNENLFSQFISISEQTNSEVQLLEEKVVEPINIYLDLISAYKDLCDRYENDLQKHSKDTNSVLKRQTSRQLSIEESLEQLERKSHFALHCILSETLLLKSYSQSIPFVLKNLVKLKIDSHKKLAQLFESMNI